MKITSNEDMLFLLFRGWGMGRRRPVLASESKGRARGLGRWEAGTHVVAFPGEKGVAKRLGTLGRWEAGTHMVL